MIVLDGPMGTQLEAQGVDTGLPRWSANALVDAPEAISAIHRAYVSAGATVHTANTFRTKRRTLGDDWETLARLAMKLAIEATPGQRVAGSIAPLEDCYRPDLSPADPRLAHRELARVLADAGADILLCETFPHVGEAIIAVEESVATGVETWCALTAGPDATLLTPGQLASAARRAVDAGASAVLVNCTPALATLPYVQALAEVGVPFGAYANAGHADDAIGWASSPQPGAQAYAAIARTWIEAGATLIGSCCGTGPSHIAALSTLANAQKLP